VPEDLSCHLATSVSTIYSGDWLAICYRLSSICRGLKSLASRWQRDKLRPSDWPTLLIGWSAVNLSQNDGGSLAEGFPFHVSALVQKIHLISTINISTTLLSRSGTFQITSRQRDRRKLQDLVLLSKFLLEYLQLTRYVVVGIPRNKAADFWLKFI